MTFIPLAHDQQRSWAGLPLPDEQMSALARARPRLPDLRHQRRPPFPTHGRPSCPTLPWLAAAPRLPCRPPPMAGRRARPFLPWPAAAPAPSLPWPAAASAPRLPWPAAAPRLPHPPLPWPAATPRPPCSPLPWVAAAPTPPPSPGRPPHHGCHAQSPAGGGGRSSGSSRRAAADPGRWPSNPAGCSTDDG